MDIWLDKLAYKESGNNPNLKVLDVNGKYSYGCLQFQEGTFRTYAIKYGLITPSTPTDSVIYNCSLQEADSQADAGREPLELARLVQLVQEL